MTRKSRYLTFFFCLLAALLVSASNAASRSGNHQSSLADPAFTPQLLHNLAPLFQHLDTNSKLWLKLDTQRIKVLVVTRYINLYRQKGITIKKPASHYVKMIDSMLQQNPDLVYQPISRLLRIAAIIDYDFANGQDPDLMARQVLGTKGYWANRERLGMP